MLPLQQAYEIKQSIIEYLKATFSFKEKEVSESFFNFIESPAEGIFKGPYISLKMPFETSDTNKPIPLDIDTGFPPYDHQYKAFHRLHTQDGHLPQPTLLTTGTGSGKTESFLFPILDYCNKHKNQRGIKVIILYPMNALATDQAKRLAEAIWGDEKLKGKITAGLFIGEGKDKHKFPSKMGESNVIENRDAIVSNPPDILLTNFKMLDYGLMRHQFHNLWHYNFEDPELLKFLVLDELHTYDGAQGTDVANLIRRLKLKLEIPKNHLCPVGTSATIGKGEDSVALLTEYASAVFGETFESDSVITEKRLTSEQLFSIPDPDLNNFIPSLVGISQSRLGLNENYNDYINRQKKLWQLPDIISPFQLSGELKKLKVIKDITGLCSKGILSIEELITQLADINTAFKRLPEFHEEGKFNPREEVITSILALIAEAKSDENEKFPFLFLQIQIWIRELSGLLRVFDKKPKFSWRDSISKKEARAALPAYYCRECGASGWLADKHDNRNQFEPDPLVVYEKYFNHNKNLYFVNTHKEQHFAIDEYEPTNTLTPFVDCSDLRHYDHMAERRVHMIAYRKVADNKTQHVCPECNSANDISIIGTRIATLDSISISQLLSSDLDERGEKYRKVLAFTNGVQDAAHQAGFIEARNYRFTFRASLQRVINTLDESVSLIALKDKFIDFWKTHSDPSESNNLEAYYYRFFPSDYLGKAEVEDYRNPSTKKFPASFEKEFDTRISWEVMAEFGYNAAIGRTLEKTGSSSVGFNNALFKDVYEAMHKWMGENLLESIDQESFVLFLNGILHRMRIRGAVDHEYLSKFRSTSVRLWDLNWMKDKRHYLNKLFHPSARFPKLVCNYPHTRNVLDTTFARKTNWFHTYFKKSFEMAPNNNALLNEFYELLFEKLAEAGILNISSSSEGDNFAINPEQLFVHKEVSRHQCSHCSSVIHVPKNDTGTAGMHCLDYRCAGIYQSQANEELNYYNLIYNRNRSPRIYASEHTGVLERKVREEIELDFKERPNYNSKNALVATSTLEMGIDVGSLNAAINTSIPPLPSNFLQRIGRAGRSSGNAVITNFAQSKAHDLFYYSEPLEMMDGDINTPGCFLNAKDILFRHFTAYCIDTWTKKDPEKNQIPGLIGSLQLRKSAITSPVFFVNQLLEFVLDNQKELIKNFSEIYDDKIDPELIEGIKTSLRQGAFQQKLIRVFEVIRDELFFIVNKEREIDAFIQENQLGQEDQERKLLEQEKKSLRQLRKAIENRQVIEHLTNVGVLPNYAFPETGVTLNALVYGSQPKGGEQEPVSKSYEIVRSAKSAIREFAPGNYFYSQGNKLEISGLNTFDWGGERSSLIVMRFCSKCDHIEDAVKSKGGACPKCGDESWNAASNVHKFARLHSVKSVNSRTKSALNDSRDDREEKYYRISTHFKFNPNTIEGTWGMKKIPFGIEYVKDVELTQLNLGLNDVMNARHISINQFDDVPNHGFVTCKHCGKSTANPREVISFDKKFHYGYCKHREDVYKEMSDDVFEEVFLLRDVRTEAIKILLPVQEFLNEATQNMFKAGLELGLKKYYKGNPQHVAFDFYSEYNVSNDRFDRYLVAYDTIPGGTGYLQKLFDPKEFTLLLTESYKAIRDCNCKDRGKDGCYRCILTYSNQYIREDLSREKAEELFGRIVNNAKEWEEINHGLSSMTKSGQIEESELELKFIHSLRIFVEKQEDKRWSFSQSKESGIVIYHLSIPTRYGSVTYLIRPQVSLGEAQGVLLPTRSDFYFKCVSVETEDGVLEEGPELEAYYDTAVYLDGYTFHASSHHLRFYQDIDIRDAISDTPNIRSWTLSWSDLILFDEEDTDELYLDQLKYREIISKLSNFPSWDSYDKSILTKKNNVERLLWYLSKNDNNFFDNELGLWSACFQTQFPIRFFKEADAERLSEEWKRISPSIIQTKAKGDFYMLSELSQANELYKTRIFTRLEDFSLMSGYEVSSLEKIEKDVWEKFWRIYNMLSVQ